MNADPKPVPSIIVKARAGADKVREENARREVPKAHPLLRINRHKHAELVKNLDAQQMKAFNHPLGASLEIPPPPAGVFEGMRMVIVDEGGDV